MADGNLPDIETLRKLLAYDPDTGVLTWLPRPEKMFKAPNRAAAWNSRFAGAAALSSKHDGYLRGDIFRRKCMAHRAAWALHYGQWPYGQIDHINGDRTDNRIENLRDVTQSDNQRNTKRRCTNSSGATGVCWEKSKGKWRATIMVDGRNKYLGDYSEFSDAVSARKAADLEFGYSASHGRDS